MNKIPAGYQNVLQWVSDIKKAPEINVYAAVEKLQQAVTQQQGKPNNNTQYEQALADTKVALAKLKAFL
tara:strand:+ start:111 stop:317 length:207 start_codon:yes stop_codon:yes gene_type:complete